MPNNILITGFPKSGKSTLLERIISSIKNRRGFLTREITKSRKRTGFEIIDNNDKTQILASTDIKTKYKVSKYYVDLAGFENIINPLFEYSENELLYIDEIGKMELFSKIFKDLVLNYLESKNLFIGTISKVYSNEFTKSIKNRSDIIIIEITSENVDEKYNEIKELIKKYFSQNFI